MTRLPMTLHPFEICTGGGIEWASIRVFGMFVTGPNQPVLVQSSTGCLPWWHWAAAVGWGAVGECEQNLHW